jgi:hypothetical protein
MAEEISRMTRMVERKVTNISPKTSRQTQSKNGYVFMLPDGALKIHEEFFGLMKKELDKQIEENAKLERQIKQLNAEKVKFNEESDALAEEKLVCEQKISEMEQEILMMQQEKEKANQIIVSQISDLKISVPPKKNAVEANSEPDTLRPTYLQSARTGELVDLDAITKKIQGEKDNEQRKILEKKIKDLSLQLIIYEEEEQILQDQIRTQAAKFAKDKERVAAEAKAIQEKISQELNDANRRILDMEYLIEALMQNIRNASERESLLSREHQELLYKVRIYQKIIEEMKCYYG